jgi:hypothetical protein
MKAFFLLLVLLPLVMMEMVWQGEKSELKILSISVVLALSNIYRNFSSNPHNSTTHFQEGTDILVLFICQEPKSLPRTRQVLNKYDE